MNSPKRWFALGVATVVALNGMTYAGSAPQTDDVQAQLASLKARIAELEGKQNESWLNGRRAEEVKALIRDVLSDADTRASLLEGGMTAGHNGQNFFLASEDGSFLLKIDGQIQIRYTANFRDNGDGGPSFSHDNGEAGFSIRRAKVQFSGHIADPRIEYAIRLAVDEGYNTVYAERIIIAYNLSDTLKIWAGEDKAPFLREELVSSARQLAVERSLVNEFFTTGYAQGVGLIYSGEMIRAQVMINDGWRSAELDSLREVRYRELEDVDFGDDDFFFSSKLFNEDGSDFALTARIDVRLAGDWSQWEDFSAWPGEDTAVFVGGAIHWEVGETGDPADNDDFFSWTLDASVELGGGLGLYIAGAGLHTDFEHADDIDVYGLVAQLGYNIELGNGRSLEPFIRYEWLDLEDLNPGGSLEDDLSLLTFGVNWYLAKHAAKLQLDVVWAFDPVYTDQLITVDDWGLSQLGLIHDVRNEDNQVALRAQFQLLF